MSDIDNEDPVELAMPDELSALKVRADLLGIKYHPSISLEKLRTKVNDSVEAASGDVTKDDEPAVVAAVEETPAQTRMRLKLEANELIRIRVTCMNPAKKDWDGEIFTAGNSAVGSFTKFVPFVDADDGWHVPRIIYNQLVQRQCQVFVTTRDARGNTSRKGKLIKEFAIEVLPPLTAEELQDLAQRQAMAKTVA